MKIFATIFPTRRLEFKIQIAPKTGKQRGGPVEDLPLIKKHHSKKGMDSLIFNPSLTLAISPAFNFDSNEAFAADRTALVPANLIYQVIGTISKVYNSLRTEKLFYTDSTDVRIMDKKKASALSRKLSLFRTNLIVSPCLIDDAFVHNEIGIMLSTSDQPIGALTHIEALALVETFEHFDVTTYTLLSAMMEQNSIMDAKLNMILDTLGRMEKANRPQQKPASMMTWNSLG